MKTSKRRFRRSLRILAIIALLLSSILTISVIGCNLKDTDNPAPAVPESLGFNQEALLRLQQDVSSGCLGNISSILIQYHEQTVFEWYGSHSGVDVKHSLFSVTKSVTSLLVGIAFDEGELLSLDDSVTTLLPRYAPLIVNDELKSGITLRHLLTMRAGFDWDELGIPYLNENNPVNDLANSSDWVAFVLNLPMSAAPGREFSYNSGISTVVSAIFQEAVGIRADQFANVHLFAPLGITDWTWSLSPTGITNGGWGLKLRPRDMAKIGTLVLGNGVYHDQRIVSEEWLDQSFQPASLFQDGNGYGLHWWLEPIKEFSGVQRAPAAFGSGGQALFIIRELGLVVVVTAEEFDTTPFPPVVILHDYVLPAIIDLAECSTSL
jgi:CubicO group peptidase (beta-lactamase class C family)